MANTQRAVYQGAHRQTLEDPDNSENNQDVEDQTSATPTDGWQKRYSDLRTHTNVQTERIKELQSQLLAAQRKEVKIPSSQDEINEFAKKYPDIYRHIRSIAMTELLTERENLAHATEEAKDKLESIERELGIKKILVAHPDFEDLIASQDFKNWAAIQPEQIQDWLYESTDAHLCIKAVDLYKAETGFKKTPRKTKGGADEAIRTRTPVETPESANNKLWKMSEIEKMHPKLFEKHEAEIELARLEGRIDPNS